MEKYVINAKRWFEKINGNTYHSVNIIAVETNESIAQSGMTYGYGEAYRQTTYDILIKKGLAKEEDRFNHELNRQRLIFICNDVTRKKDLKE